MHLVEIRLTKLDAGTLRGTEAELEQLAESIKSVGLLQPVILNSKHEVVAGRRRLHALKRLGRSHARAVVCETLDDQHKALLAERDENTCRVKYTPSQIKELADRIREGAGGAKEQAKGRQQAAGGSKEGSGGSKNGKLPGKSASGNLPEALLNANQTSGVGEVNEQAAAAAGVSRKTLEKIDAITAAAAADPERYGDLRDQMNDSGKVDGAYREMLKRQEEDAKKGQSPAELLAAAAADYCTVINQHTRRLDSLQAEFEQLKEDPLGHDIHWPTINSQLTAVRKGLHQGRPKRKCPYCSATGKKPGGACKPCRGTGHVCESIYRAGCAAVGVPAEKGDDE